MPSDLTAEVEERVQEYLDAIDERLNSDHWSGYPQTGFRYQTNASFDPGQQALIGATRPIKSPLFPQSDGNWFAAFFA